MTTALQAHSDLTAAGYELVSTQAPLGAPRGTLGVYRKGATNFLLVQKGEHFFAPPVYCSQNGDCNTCSLVKDGRDCRNHPAQDRAL